MVVIGKVYNDNNIKSNKGMLKALKIVNILKLWNTLNTPMPLKLFPISTLEIYTIEYTML